MKTILADNAEKYSGLICEEKLKLDEVTTLKSMLENPETIKFISFNFSNDFTATRGGCWGSQAEIEDPEERVEALEFFLKFTEKQLEKIKQEIEQLQIKGE